MATAINEEKLPDGARYLNPDLTEEECAKAQEEFWEEWMRERSELLRRVGFSEDFPVDLEESE